MQGNPLAGAIVTWLIKLGDWIRDLTAAGARRAITELLEFQSKNAWVVRGGGVMLIVVGVLNLFWALYKVVDTVYTAMVPAEQLKEAQTAVFKALSPSMQAEADKQSAAELKTQTIMINVPVTLFALLSAVLPIAGGVRMLSLKSYGLALTGAITASIPCISAMACCGLGEGAGIWAMVVLLNPDIKSAFR